MPKDFLAWHKRKSFIDSKNNLVFFHAREVWWCSVGLNVGFEQDGKGEKYARPVVIVAKFNNQLFWAVPLTTKQKQGKFYFVLDIGDGTPRTAVLSQLRLLDSKRLLSKVGIISKKDFSDIKKAIIGLLSP